MVIMPVSDDDLPYNSGGVFPQNSKVIDCYSFLRRPIDARVNHDPIVVAKMHYGALTHTGPK
jgi:hypothetical protein